MININKEQIKDMINEASEFTTDFEDVRDKVNDEILQIIYDEIDINGLIYKCFVKSGKKKLNL